MVNLYCKEGDFDYSIEIKFLILYISKLLKISYPEMTNIHLYKGKEEYPSYEELLENTKDNYQSKSTYIITFLNNENYFITRYISTEVRENLLFNQEDIIGYDFNEMFIPKYTSKYHALYMKQFVLMGKANYIKKTSILNKEFQLEYVKVKCKILPTINSLYCIIINIARIKSKKYRNYSAILDQSYRFLSLGGSFAKFNFSLP